MILKKDTDSVHDIAESQITEFKEWQPQGTKKLAGFLFEYALELLYFDPFIFEPLS